jgi:hypothetical protein
MMEEQLEKKEGRVWKQSGGVGVSKICVKQFWVSDSISLLAHYL